MTESEIKSAFRRKALKMHPDVRGHADKIEEDKHREDFVDLLEAVSVLCDITRRAQYDRSMRDDRTGCDWSSDYDHPLHKHAWTRADPGSSAQHRDSDSREGRGWTYTGASGRRMSGDSDGSTGPNPLSGVRGRGRQKRAEDEGMPQWAIKYEKMVSQGLLDGLLDPVLDEVDNAMDTAYFGPAFYGDLAHLHDFEAEVRNQGLSSDYDPHTAIPLMNLVSGRQLLGHVRERQSVKLSGGADTSLGLDGSHKEHGTRRRSCESAAGAHVCAYRYTYMYRCIHIDVCVFICTGIHKYMYICMHI